MADASEALRDDVRLLGDILGEVLRAQESEALLDRLKTLALWLSRRGLRRIDVNDLVDGSAEEACVDAGPFVDGDSATLSAVF